MRASRVLGAVLALASGLSACELLIDTSHLDADADGGAARDAGDARGAREDGSADAGAIDAACPGRAGPKMVRAGAFCIDRTEVTGADYAAFLAADAAEAPASCAWKHGRYDHDGAWTPINGLDGPAGNVDWCDAFVYCAWAGKRLCGAIGGGASPYAAFADRSIDQWFSACGGPKDNAYPYGDTFDEATCNGLLADGGYPDGATTYTVEPVATRPACQGGYPGVFDMSGNAAEWEDSCDDSAGGDAAAHPCRYRGGSANSDEAELACASGMSFPNPYARSASTDDLGFRCCAE